MKKQAQNPSKAPPMPLILIGIGVLLVIGALVWLGISASPGGNASVNQNTAQDIPEPGIKRVSLADAKNAFDAKTAVFVDVRDPDQFAAGHIPGSINIPVSEIETRYTELDPNAWIITYCT